MGIITAILSAIGTAISVVVSVICGIAKAVPWWVWLIPLGMILGIYMVSGDVHCSCRDLMGCRRREPRPPKPPRVVTYAKLPVVSVESGVSLTVKIGEGRRAHDQVVILQGIEAVPGKWETIAKDKLLSMAGSDVTVQVENRRRLLSSEVDNDFGQSSLLRQEDSGVEAAETPALVDRGPLVGVVIGASGINLNRAQVEGGYCRCSADAPEDLVAAERKARKARAGIWSDGGVR